MIQSSGSSDELFTNDPVFPVRVGGRERRFTYPELFATAHHLWLKGDFVQAAKVLERLAATQDRGPRAAIFLAHCRIMQGDYGVGSSLLSRALPKETYGDLASGLHDAFVFWKVGLFVEVKSVLKALALEHPELPVLNLILGDLLHQAGAAKHAEVCFRRAIQQDRKNGGVALAARKSLTPAGSPSG